jgi:integrase/recombinase XerD
MDSSNSSVTPLRQLAPKTQAAYARALRKLAAFIKKSADIASAEDLRRFQLHMVDAGTPQSRSTQPSPH